MTGDTNLATLAAWLIALDGPSLGGLCLRGPPGAARDHCLATLRRALPDTAPWRRMPARIDDERLQGGLDLGLSLAAGRPVAQAGLLAEVDQGVLLLPMAERLEMGLAARIALALDQGSSHFAVVALDESLAQEESLPSSLQERLALWVNLVPVQTGIDDPAPQGLLPDVDLNAARSRLARIPFDADCVQAFCAAAQALGVPSMRAPMQAWRVARGVAALAGRDAVAQEDAEIAARLVLAPRAKSLPEAPASEPQQDTAPQESPSESNSESAPDEPTPTDPTDAPPLEQTSPPDESEESEQGSLEEQILEAAKAAIPAGLLELLKDKQAASKKSSSAGSRGAAAKLALQGRPLSARRGVPGGGQRLDLLATMRAAIPWQRLRRAERERASRPPSASKLLLQRDDFHVRRFLSPRETTTVFAVDASGSQALNRLAEVKGAVELLLADCYVRRDKVALVAFRGDRAAALLAPTRSLVRAKRSLSALPGGGGTPLAAGIDVAHTLAQAVQSKPGSRALLVFLTDGRANIAKDGTPGRATATAEALAAAAKLAPSGIQSLLIDTSPRPQPEAMALAKAMAAHYVALPQGSAASIYRAVARLE